jgi:hypothetical protein
MKIIIEFTSAKELDDACRLILARGSSYAPVAAAPVLRTSPSYPLGKIQVEVEQILSDGAEWYLGDIARAMPASSRSTINSAIRGLIKRGHVNHVRRAVYQRNGDSLVAEM